MSARPGKAERPPRRREPDKPEGERGKKQDRKLAQQPTKAQHTQPRREKEPPEKGSSRPRSAAPAPEPQPKAQPKPRKVRSGGPALPGYVVAVADGRRRRKK